MIRMSNWPRRLLGLALLCGAACGGATDPPAEAGAPLQVTPAMYLLASMSLSELHDGDPADLVQPPQGGHVMFVGATVRDAGPGSYELRARLRATGGGMIFGEDARTVTLLAAAGEPGVWTP